MQFIESIKILDGKIFLEALHLQRINKTLENHFTEFKLWHNLPITILAKCKNGLYKCRIVFDNKTHSVDIIPYQKKNISTIQIMDAPDLEYNYKYKNRVIINHYKAQVAADCEVVFCKNNLLTDASYSNICLWNGTEWHTPAIPELHGVMRTKLLQEKKIIAKNITPQDVAKYSKISFINALNDLGESTLNL
jgi:4-amino-4-deoxychorismate lyase